MTLIMLLRIDTCSIPIGKKPGRGGELNVQGSSLSLNVLCKCNEMNSFCTLTWTLRRIHCCPLRHQEKQIRFLIKVNIIFFFFLIQLHVVHAYFLLQDWPTSTSPDSNCVQIKSRRHCFFFFYLILNPFLSYIRFYLTPSKDTATISKLEK